MVHSLQLTVKGIWDLRNWLEKEKKWTIKSKNNTYIKNVFLKNTQETSIKLSLFFKACALKLYSSAENTVPFKINGLHNIWSRSIHTRIIWSTCSARKIYRKVYLPFATEIGLSLQS